MNPLRVVKRLSLDLVARRDRFAQVASWWRATLAVWMVLFLAGCGGPTVKIDTPQQTVSASIITLTGSITLPEGATLVSVVAKTPSGTFNVPMNGLLYSIELPLVLGLNKIDVTVTATAANAQQAATASVNITRISLPKFSGVTPVNGAELSTADITLVGEVVTDWALASVQFMLDGKVKPMTEVRKGVYRFNEIKTLLAGTNTFQLLARTPDGEDKLTLTLHYKAPVDATPPVLTVVTPSPQTTEATTVTLTGTVSDPEQAGSGIAALTVISDRTGSQQYAPSLSGQNYSVQVPLSPGDNRITLNARDRAGNQSSVNVTVQRISPPRFGSVTPADGTLYKDQPVAVITGEFATAWPASDIRLFFNDVPHEFASSQSGNYIFKIDQIPLREGTNIFALRVNTPDGEAIRNVSLVYRDERDITPPTIVLDAQNNERIESISWVLTGKVSDPVQPGSGVASVTVTLNHTGSTSYPVQIDGEQIRTSIPLRLGANTLTVTAADLKGNVASSTLIVIRVSPPVLTVTEPQDNASIRSETTTVRGQVATAWPLDQISVSVNGSVLPLVPSSSGVYTFALEQIPLVVGDNTLTLRATTPDGEQTRAVRLTRISEPDTTPPELSLDNPQDQKIESASVRVSGIAKDPQQYGSGIASVSVQAGGTEYAATREGDAFSVDIPLVVGSNSLTVTASDISGNKATQRLHVQRTSRPQVISLEPADGTVFKQPWATVSGEFATEWPVGDARLNVNGQAVNLVASQPGRYTFSLADISLEVGENNIRIQALTPDGSDSRDLTLTFEPDPDTQPPVVQLTSPDHVITEDNITQITGTVTDAPHYFSGIESFAVTSDRFPAVFSPMISAETFRVTVPLAVGENELTLVAKDRSGNPATKSVHVKRLSRPQLVNLRPQSGAFVTAKTVTIAGDILTHHPVEAIRVRINDWLIAPTATTQDGVYHFESSAFELTYGDNAYRIDVQTPDGPTSTTVNIVHRPEDADSIPPPTVSIVSPSSSRLISEPSFALKVRVTSQGGAASLKVNGLSQAIASGMPTDFFAEAWVTFQEGRDSVDVELEATDALGKRSTGITTYRRDGTPPVLIFNNALSPAPQFNTVADPELVLAGSVKDANLASLTLNDEPVALRLGAVPDEYVFGLVLRIPPGSERVATWVARDSAGNATTRDFVFKSEAITGIEVVSPEEGAVYLHDGAIVPLQVAARIGDALPQARVRVRIGTGQSMDLEVNGVFASGTLDLPTQAGVYPVLFELLDREGRKVASASRSVEVKAESMVELVLERLAPGNGAQNIEPNQPLEFHFNKAIDPSRLSLNVTETLHGKTYVNHDPSGADFLSAKGYQLQDVHRDSEPVPGTLSVLPEHKSVAFYPARHFGYASTVNVEIFHDDVSMGRSIFAVRKLPTFVTGGITDQFGEPLGGVTVSLPSLDRSTVTNRDGAFAFGFQEEAGHEIPGGRYELIVNPAFVLPGYGSYSTTINLQEGRKNNLGRFRLQELSPTIPFQPISGGVPQVSLASDALKLDLSAAKLVFPDGRANGAVQMQFFPIDEFDVPFFPGTAPQWAFAAQPRRILVEGPVGLTLKMPPMYGGYDYIFPDMKYVVLVAFDREDGAIKPVGIGRISNYTVSSVGKIAIDCLDYLGYAIIDPVHQSLLEDIAAGRRSLSELLAILRR